MTALDTHILTAEKAAGRVQPAAAHATPACSHCEGHGWVTHPHGASLPDVACPRCSGTGREETPEARFETYLARARQRRAAQLADEAAELDFNTVPA